MKKNSTRSINYWLCLVLLLWSMTASAQNIQGTITDDKNEPLIGASVIVEGTTKGAITDVKGMYSLDLTGVDKDAALIFSFVGFDNQRIAIAGRSVIDVVLKEGSALNEVVVVGYGTQKRKDLTGSIATANLDAFKESPNVSILQSLKGALPGLTIGQTNRAGEEASIGIRGQSTLNGNTSPLIIVDGIIFNGRLSDINPTDVASVDVLKDPSSKAIYGSQAANGVVLVTTKTGKFGQKPTITYSGSYAVSEPTVKARLLNRDEFLQKVKDIEYKKAYTAASGFLEPVSTWTYANSDFLPPSIAGAGTTNDFDWYSALTQPSLISSHTLGVSGGSDKTKYFLSAGRTNEKGFIKNDDYTRYTLRMNIDTDIADWLTMGANVSGAFTDFSGESPNMNTLVGTNPLVLPTNAAGDYVVNPLGDLNVNPFLPSTNDNYEVQNRLVGNFYGLFRVPKVAGLTYRVNFGHNLKFFKDYGSSIYGAGITGSAYKNDATAYEQTLDNIINYTHSFGKHNINATGVYGYNTAQFNRTAASGTGFTDLNLSYNNLALAEIQKISSEAWKEALLYQVGSLAYNYDGKYLVKATVRRDGFSGFSKNNKTGIFPSIGLGWVVSQENFFKVPFVNFLKIRGSYGENGNKVGRYSSLARIENTDASKYVFGDGGSTAIGRSVSTLANTDLRWEKTRGVNIGADFAIWDNRIDGNIEYYNSNTFDLLWEQVLPQTSGFQKVFTNIGQLNNSGVEFMLHATPVKRKDFSWDITLNFSKNDNKIVTLTGEDKDKNGIEDDLIASGLFIGKSIGTLYGYQTNGINGLSDTIIKGFEAGSYKIVDQNGDGKITPELDRVVLGRKEAAYQFGIQNTLSYKQFKFSFFINSVQGGDNGYLSENFPYGYNGTKGNATNSNWFNFHEIWSPRNPDAKYPNPWVGTPVGARQYFSRSFVRLQDVALSYKLDNNLTKKFGIQNASIFVSGKNLLTLTKWEGWDPETNTELTLVDNSKVKTALGITSINAFPVMKSFSIGIEVGF
jgi:TonB-dependent starch-binding outer membrane protein SusC